MKYNKSSNKELSMKIILQNEDNSLDILFSFDQIKEVFPNNKEILKKNKFIENLEEKFNKKRKRDESSQEQNENKKNGKKIHKDLKNLLFGKNGNEN